MTEDATTTLSEACSLITKGTTPTSVGYEFVSTGVRFVKVESLSNGEILHTRCAHISADAHDALGRSQLQEGDVLFSIAGTLGRTAIVRAADVPANTNQALAILRPGPDLDREFLRAFLESVAESTASANGRGVGLQNINLRQLGDLEVPIVSVDEQRRIVAKLDALRARSRRATEALDAVPALLDKLRQSILAAAFRGDLTADWRAANPDVEPASELLKRIRVERRKRWEEAELAKMVAKGKAPKDDKWKAKYVEPEPVDESDLPELPDGWCWATVEDLATNVVDCPHTTPAYVEVGVPAIRTADVERGRLVLEGARRVTQETYGIRVERLVPEAGDILYTREGERFGLAALVPRGVQLCMAQRMMLIRATPATSPAFLMWGLNSPVCYEQAKADVGGSTSPHVNISSIRRFAVPFAPRPEQEAIAITVEKTWASIDSLAELHFKCAAEVLGLDSRVLFVAFRGELTTNQAGEP